MRIRPTEFCGDIHLHPLERAWTPQVLERLDFDMPFWIIAAGGKRAPDRWQAVVDHFQGRILFVQVGANADRHSPLRGVLDMQGQTDVRRLIRLVHHSAGVLCPARPMAAGGDEAKRAFIAMMEMGKIDHAKIEAARRG